MEIKLLNAYYTALAVVYHSTPYRTAVSFNINFFNHYLTYLFSFVSKYCKKWAIFIYFIICEVYVHKEPNLIIVLVITNS